MHVYPNPVTDIAVITYSNPDAKEHLIRLYDVTGKLILETSNTSETFTLTKGDLNEGIYFLTITGVAHSMSKKVLFQ